MDSVSLVDSNDEEGSGDFRHLILDENQMTTSITEQAIDKVESPIKPAVGWTAAPADALEFTIMYSAGLIRLSIFDSQRRQRKI